MIIPHASRCFIAYEYIKFGPFYSGIIYFLELSVFSNNIVNYWYSRKESRLIALGKYCCSELAMRVSCWMLKMPFIDNNISSSKTIDLRM